MADEHNISLLDNTTGTPPTQPLSSTSSTSSAPETSHIDVLYENQRGWFIFGLPLFSSKALWNSKIDQSPWVDARFKPSAVNITNAQVPDPSWVWDWKSWYVDMSYDVDEEGWQYNLWFRGGTAWHGNHPWFHSFVRRRRWLRRRVKRKAVKKGEGWGVGNGSESLSISTGTMMSRTLTQGTSMGFGEKETENLDEEIKDVPTLMKKLKKAAIDREKIVYINRFIVEGGEELHYLAEQVPMIMSMLVFQNSRRQLLASLTNTIDDARAHRDQHLANHTPESAAEERRINNLLKAVEAADAECKKLEFWSDIRGLAQKGQAVNAVNGESWGKGWEGLDQSGPAHPERGDGEDH